MSSVPYAGRRCGGRGDEGAFCNQREKFTGLRMCTPLLERQAELPRHLHLPPCQPTLAEGAQRPPDAFHGRLHLAAGEPHAAQHDLGFCGLYRIAGPLCLFQRLRGELLRVFELPQREVGAADLSEDGRPIERAL